jgi:hypothetical protein
MYTGSTNSGSTWRKSKKLTSSAAVLDGSICVSGRNVHVAWTDARDVSNTELYYRTSRDGGASWQKELPLTSSTRLSAFPTITSSGSSLHVLWTDSRDKNWQIYYKQNPNGNVLAGNPDLDIYDEGADLAGDMMQFPLDRRFRENQGISSSLHILARMKDFLLVNADKAHNPDPDGPSHDKNILTVKSSQWGVHPQLSDKEALDSLSLQALARFYPQLKGTNPQSATKALELLNAFVVSLLHEEASAVLRAIVVVPKTLALGRVARGHVVVLSKPHEMHGVYKGTVMIEGIGESSGLLTRDFYRIQAVVGDPIPFVLQSQ